MRCHSNITLSESGVTSAMKKDLSVLYRINTNKNLKKAGKETLGDDFIINKISEGKFNNLEDWKKHTSKKL